MSMPWKPKKDTKMPDWTKTDLALKKLREHDERRNAAAAAAKSASQVFYFFFTLSFRFFYALPLNQFTVKRHCIVSNILA